MKTTKKKNKNEFPGYPHYAATEDITQQQERYDADVENVSGSVESDNSKLNVQPGTERRVSNTPEIVPDTAADLTKEDLLALGTINGDNDGGEDETLLPGLKIGPDLSGDDLDVPGSELDDEAESTGSEDEENNYYSRGQD